MKGLIGCEESGIVTKAFRDNDFNFYSCDILPTSGKLPQYHIQDDIFHVLSSSLFSTSTQFFGCHPPCTYLANSGVRWLYNKDGSKNEERWQKMEQSALFFKSLYHNLLRIGKGYIENPIMHKYALEIIGVKPSQIIQPWQFGHGETKATCLWIVGLPNLKPTNIVDGREQRMWKLPPSKDRAMLRSKTYSGIAWGMVKNWSKYLEK